MSAIDGIVIVFFVGVRNDLLFLYGGLLLLMVHAKHSRAEAGIQRFFQGRFLITRSYYIGYSMVLGKALSGVYIIGCLNAARMKMPSASSYVA